MGVFQTASDIFFSVCSTLALSVTTVTECVAILLHKNYILVTNLYSFTSYIGNLVITTLSIILHAVSTVALYLFDFLAEIYACVCALLVLLWRICVLVYKVFCLIFTGLETFVLCAWNGSVLTYRTLQQSASDVMEACDSTTDYISMMMQDLVVYVCDIFTAVGVFFTWIVRGLWVGIGYIPYTASCIPSYLSQWVTKQWMRLSSWVSFTFMGITQETYIGIGICCVVYMILSKLVHFLHSRGLSLFSFRRRRYSSTRRNTEVLPVAFDRDFESDLEDDDMEDSSQEASDNEHSDTGEDSDAGTELTLSDGDSEDDDNSAGSESDVSLNSETFTSEESDLEIHVELPTSSGDHPQQSGSSTPSRSVPKDMNSDDFERELERERDKRKCVVCQDVNKSVLILPCKHMCLCVRCANQIVRSTVVGRRLCPLCRRRIERVMDVYV